jgi:Phage integrase family
LLDTSSKRQNRRVLEMILVLVRSLALACRGHHELALENLALRQQLNALRRTVTRPRLRTRIGCFGSSWLTRGGTGERHSCSCSPTPWCDGIGNGSAGDRAHLTNNEHVVTAGNESGSYSGEGHRTLTVREAVYEGRFDTPKTQAGIRQIPLSDPVVRLVADWRARSKQTDPDALVFSTWSGKPISPNNVLRQQVFPACEALGLKRVTWLTMRRTYSSWAHEKGVPGKVVAQLMGHAKVDTTLNVYTQVIDGALRAAVDEVGSELFTIVHKPENARELTH